MLEYRTTIDESTREEIVETSLSGHELLENPIFNKGSAFTRDERDALGLRGLLPGGIGSLADQIDRRYAEFGEKPNDLEKYIFLTSLQDRNETLFYALLHEHIEETTPIVYTPTVGEACRRYSRIFRRPRGLYFSSDRGDQMDEIFANRLFREVDVAVVTDGERVLGLGDLGVGGMGIPVGKLSLYTLCGGIHPARTLPIYFDVGTDNAELLADPYYLGARHPRMRGDDYLAFVDKFVDSFRRNLPDALLQWEDFAITNARTLVDRHRERVRSFNDDVEGTAAVALAAIYAAAKRSGVPFRDQRIVILGAGSAGTGIADLIVAALRSEGLSRAEATDRLWLVDKNGLLIENMKNLHSFQKPYQRKNAEISDWKREGDRIALLETVERVRPTVLIGVSGRAGGFDEGVIRAMARGVDRPVVLPMSNPTVKSEASPSDILAWTEGKAIVATGSPFDDVSYRGVRYAISQSNNSYIFPGVGLGIVATRAVAVNEGFFLAAARALAATSPSASGDPGAPLFPRLSSIRAISLEIAVAVAIEATRRGLAPAASEAELRSRVAERQWLPLYHKTSPARSGASN